MLSCFPFSYSPLKDDYSQLFIGQNEQIVEESEENCLNIDLYQLESDSVCNQTCAASDSRNNSDTHTHSNCEPNTESIPKICNSKAKRPQPIPRTFRKPDTVINADCSETIDSSINSSSGTNLSKLNRFKLGFYRLKGTEHLQQESLRKCNESSVSHSQRYIKLPTSASVSKFSESTCNKSEQRSVRNASVSANASKSIITENRNLLTATQRSTKSLAPSCSQVSHASQPSPKPLGPPRPPQLPQPPRPLTSHPGIAGIAGKTRTIMPRQKVQWASANTCADNADNISSNSTSNSTRDTGLASVANSTTTSTTISNPNNTSTNATRMSSNHLPVASTSSSSSLTSPDWSKGGTFINKPSRGWLHPDQKIAETGVLYAVRYIGCLGINTSMKSLDFDTRSQIAKECINKVCESGGLKTADKKRRTEKRINRMLAETPNMESAGANVNLNITSSYLNLTIMETDEIIAKHDMPNISFASGGDADTLDFVAYVAKDQRYGRACFVLECGGGLAQDVITTIGQAFELRFKEFLKRTPRNTAISERFESTQLNGTIDGSVKNSNCGIEDREYYNDLPGKIPPDFPTNETHDNKKLKDKSALQKVIPQAAPRSFKKINLSNNEQSSPNLIDLNTDIQENSNSESTSEADSNNPEVNRLEHEYVNCASTDTQSIGNNTKEETETSVSIKDPFDMQPFNSALAEVTTDSLDMPSNNHNWQLESEEWYHGPISRKESEALVVCDGDFLVRESQGSPGQYVLTGMQSAIRKHLLLVDPEGVVRTKDKTFESVSHLINYHRNNGLPIISAESALVLRNAVLVNR